MFIKLQNHYFNLDCVAEFALNSETIIVLVKGEAAHTYIKYKSKAEAEAAYEALGEQIVEYNKAKMK